MTDSLPILRGETATADGGIALRLWLPADLSLFSGHFPGFPLLPGVAQIHWAAQLGRKSFGIGGGFSRLLNIKFQKPVQPDCELELTLNWDAGRRQLAFHYASAAGSHASGKIEFAGGEDTP